MSFNNFAYKNIIQPLLFRIDAETAHRYMLNALAALPYCKPAQYHEADAVQIGSLTVPSPVGLAAGFDKNAQAPDYWLSQGCGFVEIGTVTPLPQQGNDLPRLFRLIEDKAVINRMGFNNDGAAAVRQRLKYRRHRGGIIGANIGANKDSPDRLNDYVQVFKQLHQFVDYITINISSPNTPQLRNLQTAQSIAQLLQRLIDERADKKIPLWLKLAPDFDNDDLFLECIAAAEQYGAEALVISNTTIDRPKTLKSPHTTQSGGLSGAPLFEKSHALVALTARHSRLPIVAVGGIDTPEKAALMRQAGACAVQIYTGLIYQGPALIRGCAQALRGVPLAR